MKKLPHIVSDSVSLMKERKSSIYDKNDTLATRVKKLQAIKESTYSDKSSRRIQIKEVKTISEEPNNHDVQFLIQVIDVFCVFNPHFILIFSQELCCSFVLKTSNFR